MCAHVHVFSGHASLCVWWVGLAPYCAITYNGFIEDKWPRCGQSQLMVGLVGLEAGERASEDESNCFKSLWNEGCGKQINTHGST